MSRRAKATFLFAVLLIVAAGLLVTTRGSALGQVVLPSPPKEMQVLKKFVGRWQSEIKLEFPFIGALWGKVDQTVDEKLDGWYIQGRVKGLVHLTSSGKDCELTFQSMWLMTFDTEKKLYRRWEFSTFGGCDEHAGLWNEETSSFTLTKMDNGRTEPTSTLRFVDDNTYEWKSLRYKSSFELYRRVKEKEPTGPSGFLNPRKEGAVPTDRVGYTELTIPGTT
jgi:hypothetical protein